MAIPLLGAGCESVMADNYPTEQDYLQELPIVLSASRLAQPISETPNAMTVINRDMIKASGFRNIADLFRLVPGMYVGYENGHTPIVAYRGTTDALARRMQVLIDGRTVYLPYYGQVDWAELPLDIDDIERIEVIRGPSAASHGSNSVQGVICIYTRQAGHQRLQLSARRGDAGVSDTSVRWGSSGENFDYRVTLASHADSGFEGVIAGNGAQRSINDDNSNHLVNLRASYRPTSNDSLDAQLGYSNTTRTDGDPNLSLGHHNTLRDGKARNNFQQLTWLHTVQKNSDIQLSYYHIGRNMADDRPFSQTNSWINDDATINRHELELQHTLITSVANRVVWGIGMRDDSVDSPNNFLSPIRWKEYRIFAHDEWRITPASLVNIGAMVEKNALGQTRVSPRAAYNYHLTPRHTLRVSASVAYRNPEMIEQSGASRFWRAADAKWWRRFTAVGGLSPERAFSREVGYLGQLDEAGSTLDIRLYSDHIQNIIWVDPVPYPGAVDNRTNNFRSLFSATHTGLEGILNYKFGARTSLTMNYAHQFVEAIPAGRLTFYPMSVLYQYAARYEKTVPQISASLLLSHNFSDGMQLSAGFYHQDPVRVLDGGSLQPLMRRLDLRVAKRFGAARGAHRKTENTRPGSGEVALVLQNALSDHYSDYNEDFVNKRRAYVTATLEF